MKATAKKIFPLAFVLGLAVCLSSLLFLPLRAAADILEAVLLAGAILAALALQIAGYWGLFRLKNALFWPGTCILLACPATVFSAFIGPFTLTGLFQTSSSALSALSFLAVPSIICGILAGGSFLGCGVLCLREDYLRSKTATSPLPPSAYVPDPAVVEAARKKAEEEAEAARLAAEITEEPTAATVESPNTQPLQNLPTEASPVVQPAPSGDAMPQEPAAAVMTADVPTGESETTEEPTAATAESPNTQPLQNLPTEAATAAQLAPSSDGAIPQELAVAVVPADVPATTSEIIDEPSATTAELPDTQPLQDLPIEAAAVVQPAPPGDAMPQEPTIAVVPTDLPTGESETTKDVAVSTTPNAEDISSAAPTPGAVAATVSQGARVVALVGEHHPIAPQAMPDGQTVEEDTAETPSEVDTPKAAPVPGAALAAAKVSLVHFAAAARTGAARFASGAKAVFGRFAAAVRAGASRCAAGVRAGLARFLPAAKAAFGRFATGVRAGSARFAAGTRAAFTRMLQATKSLCGRLAVAAKKLRASVRARFSKDAAPLPTGSDSNDTPSAGDALPVSDTPPASDTSPASDAAPTSDTPPVSPEALPPAEQPDDPGTAV